MYVRVRYVLGCYRRYHNIWPNDIIYLSIFSQSRGHACLYYKKHTVENNLLDETMGPVAVLQIRIRIRIILGTLIQIGSASE
jgi:hypothetical protein